MGIIHRVEKYHYILISVMLIILFAAENTELLGLSGLINYSLLYFLKILLWIGLGVMLLIFPSVMPSGLIRLKETVIFLALIFGIFHLLCLAVLGFFSSFAKSPYDLSIVGTLSNIAPMLAALFGAELCRSFLINSRLFKRAYTAILFSSVLFAIFSLNLGKIAGLESTIDTLDYLTETVFPQLTQSFAASCLVYLAGPAASMLYLGIIRSFAYISPYIPNLTAIPKLLFNVLFPLVCVMIIFKIYSGEVRRERQDKAETKDILEWLAISVLSVGIVWFSVGLFPLFPSVILTGSMEPGIMPGDIVLVKKVDGESVNIGDIVMYYSEDGVNITHRVIGKLENSGVAEYITKGDNNPIADPQIVGSEQVKGRIITVIPKFGKPALYIRNLSTRLNLGGTK